MTTLLILDTLAELIHLAYDLGAATRRYVLPGLIATFVLGQMAFDYARGFFPKSRQQMTKELMAEWKLVIKADPEGDESEIPEYAKYLGDMSDEELSAEYSNL